jgi:hypothetical protein
VLDESIYRNGLLNNNGLEEFNEWIRLRKGRKERQKEEENIMKYSKKGRKTGFCRLFEGKIINFY